MKRATPLSALAGSSNSISLSPEGKVIYELRHPWRDGTTHFIFDPLEFIDFTMPKEYRATMRTDGVD